MMYGNAPFWQAFLNWQVGTKHPWDIGLQVEAMCLCVDALERQLRETLLPVITQVAVAVNRLFEAFNATTD